jgi:hypothetical protein
MSQQFVNFQNDTLLNLALHITRIIKNNPVTTLENLRKILNETNILSSLS